MVAMYEMQSEYPKGFVLLQDLSKFFEEHGSLPLSEDKKGIISWIN